MARLSSQHSCILAVAIILCFSITGSATSSAGADLCRSWGARGTMYPAVGRRTISISDVDRDNRTLTVDIWYPSENNGEPLTRYNPLLPSEGRYVALDDPNVALPKNYTTGTIDGYPLLVFSHGFGGIRQQSAKLMEHLASWGFVIASPDHAGNSRNDPPGADIPFVVTDRPKDLSFVMDTLLSSPYIDDFHLRGNVDRGVGVLGHSFGGLTSLLIAPDGPFSDSRVKAIMPISPSIRLANNVFDLSKINIPTLLIGGVNDTITPVEPNNVVAFEKTSGLPRYNIILSDAGHTSFADICILFDTMSTLLGEDTAYSLLGEENAEDGRDYVTDSICETYEEVQTIMGYYATSFFYSMLKLGNDAADKEERRAIMECMAEQSSNFSLVSTFEVQDGDGSSGPVMAPVDNIVVNTTSPTPAPSSNITMAAGNETGDNEDMSSSCAFSIKATIRAFLAIASLELYFFLFYS